MSDQAWYDALGFISTWPAPMSAPNLVEAYLQACSLSSFAVEDQGRQALREHLDGLRDGLGSEAFYADWRIDDVGGCRYLLIPAYDADRRLVAVRATSTGVPLANASGFAREPQFPLDTRHSTVVFANGEPGARDVPIPLTPGTFDADFLWVSRDPVDALLLGSVGVNAVTLAAPCATLGSLEDIEWLVDLGVLTRRTEPRGTIVVVDPGETLGDERGGLLRGLFEHVIEATRDDVPDRDAPTGHELARMVSLYTRNGLGPEGIERALQGPAMNLGVLNTALPVPLPSRAGDRGGVPGAGTRKPLALISARALDDQGDTTPWVAKPFAAARAITDFHGPTKAGKTTLLLALSAAVAQDGYFLGHKCKGGPVVYVTEQTEGTIRASAVGAAALADGLHFLTLEATFGRSLDEIVAFVRRECRRLGARLVVIDTLGPIARLGGDADNTPGAAREVYRSLRPLTFDGLAVVVVRHSRKAKGSIYETAAGSVAFTGEADHLVRFTQHDKQPELREIEVVGRLSESVKMTVVLEDSGWAKAEAEEGEPQPRSPKNQKPLSGDVVVKVFEHVGEAGASAEEISHLSLSIGGAHVEPGTVRNRLGDQLKGKVEKTGTKGADGKPRYRLTSSPLSSTPVGGGNE